MRKAFRYGRTYRSTDGPTLIIENVVCVQMDLINVSNLQKAAAIEINISRSASTRHGKGLILMDK